MPPHLKHVTTVPCNLSFFTALVCDCYLFSGINLSQGSVATYARCSEIFNYRFIANLQKHELVEKFRKLVKV